MTDARSSGIRNLAGPALAFISFSAAAAISPGCHGSAANTTTGTTETSSTSSSGGTGGSGGSSACGEGSFQGHIAPGANGGFTDAFDATPDAQGKTVFFTGVDATGNPGVFKQGICPAGPLSAVYTGGVFEAPFGIAISTDDQTLFVADLSAAEDPTDITKDKGVLFKLSAAGGMAPSVLAGSVSPRSVTVVQESGADQVYFTGIDKANGLAGVFKVAASGGAVTTVAEGPPFSDPAGITVSSKGDIYVLDTSALASGQTGSSGTGLGQVILVKGGTATTFAPSIQVGYPAGLAIMSDDSTLPASGLDATARTDALVKVDVASQAVTNDSSVIGIYSEAAGLHRARAVDVFAWADTKASPMGLTGTGTVFVIK